MIRFLQVSDIHFLYCGESEDEYSQLRERFKEDLECLKKKVRIFGFGQHDSIFIEPYKLAKSW